MGWFTTYVKLSHLWWPSKCKSWPHYLRTKDRPYLVDGTVVLGVDSAYLSFQTPSTSIQQLQMNNIYCRSLLLFFIRFHSSSSFLRQATPQLIFLRSAHCSPLMIHSPPLFTVSIHHSSVHQFIHPPHIYRFPIYAVSAASTAAESTWNQSTNKHHHPHPSYSK